ncbi:MAG: hypothetical protein GY819_18275 [Planctomycetaceae bacterium]|nr:hypothetical protein [Planctomycetaceae bacterium]
MAQLASRHGVHAKRIGQWKRTAKDALPSLLERTKPIAATVSDEEMARLYEEIGRLKMENDSLKKDFRVANISSDGCDFGLSAAEHSPAMCAAGGAAL